MVGYLVSGIITFILSFFLGIISEWNEKVFFFTIVGYMSLVLVGLMYFGDKVYEGWNTLKLIIDVIAAVVGFLLGGKFYNLTFQEEKGLNTHY